MLPECEMRFPRKAFRGLKASLGSEGGDRQGDSDRMIWAATRCSEVAVAHLPFTKRGKAESLFGALVLAPSNRTMLKILRFLPYQTSQTFSQ